MKRLALSAVTITALLFGGGTAIAAGGTTTVDTTPVSFVLTSAACALLPPGTSISGSGTQTSITTTHVHNGVTTVKNATSSRGTATDQANNVYTFEYFNTFRASNSVANPDLFSGLMFDVFRLSGNGSVRLHNGFISTFTGDPTFLTLTIQPGISWGDPIAFAPAPLAAHCDPL